MNPSTPAVRRGNAKKIIPLVCSGSYRIDGTNNASKLLEKFGYTLKESTYLKLGSRKQRPNAFDYLAMEPATLGKSFASALQDKNADVIWAVRGGFGSTIALMNNPTKPQVPIAPLIGFSDITAIHLWLYANRIATSIHGPNLNGLANQPTEVIQETIKLIEGKGTNEPLNLGANVKRVRKGVAEGIIIGGNLSVMASLIGTKFFPSLKHSILLIEDVGEHPYRIHRMIAQLYAAGALHEIAGVILGEFTPPEGIEYEQLQEFVQRLILEYLPANVPVIATCNIGHGKYNYPIPFGVTASLDATNKELIPTMPWVVWENA